MANVPNGLPCGVVVFDDDGLLTYADTALCTLLGMERRAYIGKSIEVLLSPKIRPFYRAYLLPLLKIGQDVADVYLPLVDEKGDDVPMIVSCTRRTIRNGSRNIGACTRVGRKAEYESEILAARRQLEAIQAENREILARLEVACSELTDHTFAWKKLEEDLGSLATHDSLTGLVNRRGFEVRFEDELSTFAKSQVPFSIMICDIDHFKQINDNFGHGYGDLVLRKIALLLEETVRKFDFLARWGGDEFVILLPRSRHDSAILAAERLRHVVQLTHFGDIQVTLSIGIATCDVSGLSSSDLMTSADRALYASKRNGKNRVAHSSDIENLPDRRFNGGEEFL